MTLTNKINRLKMIVTHVFDGLVYEISNFTVSRNRLFKSKSDQKRFLSKFSFYFDGLCDLLFYVLEEDGFKMIIKLKSREAFIQFYKKKYAINDFWVAYIPETNYIFSQEMSNFQVSYVKYFNSKYNRVGSLMARRFRKRLFIDSETIGFILKNYSTEKTSLTKGGEWAEFDCKKESFELYKYTNLEVGEDFIKEMRTILGGSFFKIAQDLRGYKIHQAEIHIIPQFHRQLIKKFKDIYHFRPNYN